LEGSSAFSLIERKEHRTKLFKRGNDLRQSRRTFL